MKKELDDTQKFDLKLSGITNVTTLADMLELFPREITYTENGVTYKAKKGIDLIYSGYNNYWMVTYGKCEATAIELIDALHLLFIECKNHKVF